MVEVSQGLSEEEIHDPLTGLANQQEFMQRLESALESARSGGNKHAVCYMDLNQFRRVNESLGRAAGDELLRQLAGRMREAVRQSDTLARVEDDEFGLLLRGCPREMAVKICSSLRQVIEDFEFTWDGEKVRVGVSMGLVPVTAQSGDTTEVMDSAQAACQVARESGPNRTYVYKEDDQALAQRRGEAEWKRHIREALAENRFQLHSQRVLALAGNGEEAHREFLLRMQDPSGQLIVPSDFLPAARHHRLMTEIDQWVVQHAFALLEKTPEKAKPGCYTLNISDQSVTDEFFLDFVVERLERYQLDPSTICFDITEGTVVANLSAVTRFTSRLGELGCQFAIDDFCANLGSFVYLKNLPVGYLKLDGEFIRDVATDRLSHAIVSAVQGVAKTQGMRTVAEQVEGEDSLAVLRELGFDYAQGYAIERPVPLSDQLAPAAGD